MRIERKTFSGDVLSEAIEAPPPSNVATGEAVAHAGRVAQGIGQEIVKAASQQMQAEAVARAKAEKALQDAESDRQYIEAKLMANAMMGEFTMSLADNTDYLSHANMAKEAIRKIQEDVTPGLKDPRARNRFNEWYGMTAQALVVDTFNNAKVKQAESVEKSFGNAYTQAVDDRSHYDLEDVLKMGVRNKVWTPGEAEELLAEGRHEILYGEVRDQAREILGEAGLEAAMDFIKERGYAPGSLYNVKSSWQQNQIQTQLDAWKSWKGEDPKGMTYDAQGDIAFSDGNWWHKWEGKTLKISKDLKSWQTAGQQPEVDFLISEEGWQTWTDGEMTYRKKGNEYQVKMDGEWQRAGRGYTPGVEGLSQAEELKILAELQNEQNVREETEENIEMARTDEGYRQYAAMLQAGEPIRLSLVNRWFGHDPELEARISRQLLADEAARKRDETPPSEITDPDRYAELLAMIYDEDSELKMVQHLINYALGMCEEGGISIKDYAPLMDRVERRKAEKKTATDLMLENAWSDLKATTTGYRPTRSKTEAHAIFNEISEQIDRLEAAGVTIDEAKFGEAVADAIKHNSHEKVMREFNKKFDMGAQLQQAWDAAEWNEQIETGKARFRQYENAQEGALARTQQEYTEGQTGMFKLPNGTQIPVEVRDGVPMVEQADGTWISVYEYAENYQTLMGAQ